MRLKSILLLLVLCLPGIVVVAQQREEWWRVVKADNAKWDSASNLFLLYEASGDSVTIMNFTDQGARVQAFIRDGRITVPQQTRTITPFGGDGKVKPWDIIVSAEGSIHDSLMELAYTMRIDTYRTSGHITARKWSVALDNARVRWERAHPDTVINGTAFPVRLYTVEGKLSALGQRYKGGVKNGRWIFIEQGSTVYTEAGYLNDTLHGWFVEGLVLRNTGQYLKGVKVGRWLQLMRRKKRWVCERFSDYDNHGRLLSRGDTYPNGKPSKIIFYNESGAAVWYMTYREDGTISYEGEQAQGFELLELSR